MPAAVSASRMTSAGTSSEWPRIGATPAELVHREGSLRLLRYRPAEPAAPGTPPLFLVMPVINRSYVVDLTPATSFVGALQESGVDVFMVDWGRPTIADRKRGLDDLVTKILPRLEKKALAAAGATKLVLAGYCLGGTIAVCRAARGDFAGLVTIHAPVSFKDAGMLGTFTKPENFPLEKLLEAYGNPPGWFIQQGFYGLKPLQQVAKYRKLVDGVEKEALEEFVGLERWNNDNVPLTGAFYQTLIEELYRGDQLAKGTLTLAGEKVNLANVKCPTLVIRAKDDPICLPGQATALLEKVSSTEKATYELTGGHVRSLIAPSKRKKVAARIAQFISGKK